MRGSRLLPFTLPLLGLACSPGRNPASAPVTVAQPLVGQPPEPVSQQLAVDTALTTASGGTFTAPASWWHRTAGDVHIFEEPQRELTVWFVETTAPDRAAATLAAWHRVNPRFALAIARSADVPGDDGWEALGQTVYVTKAEESRVVVGAARRKGDRWYVVLIDGKAAALDRRGAQLQALVDSFRVPGMDLESFAGTPALDPARLAKLDAFVEEARALTGIPGVAIAVVHRGAIVLEKGYGVRALGGKQPVTPKTLFMIASITKSLTTLLLAKLVDDGKLGWTTPIKQLWPEFALADEATTTSLTVKHTVCACTGMPRQDLEFLFEYSGWTPERRIASMATMKPTTGFGETFQYSNLMVAAGGFVAAKVHAPKLALGRAFDDALTTKLLAPLGMTQTTVDFARAERGEHAKPHATALDLVFAPSSLDNERAIAAVQPAGAAWSTAHDMAQYVMLELARGKLPNGTQLVSEANLLERHKPQVKIDNDTSYGLGLAITNEKGAKLIGHGGNMLGYTSDMVFLPGGDMGYVLLTNAGGANRYRAAIKRRFLELVYDAKPRAMLDLVARTDVARKQLAEDATLVKAAPDPAWIDPLLGVYESAGLGRVELRRDKDRYLLDAGEWRAVVSQKIDRDGTKLVILISPPLAGFTFAPRMLDGRQVLVVDAGQQVYTFARR